MTKAETIETGIAVLRFCCGDRTTISHSNGTLHLGAALLTEDDRLSCHRRMPDGWDWSRLYGCWELSL